MDKPRPSVPELATSELLKRELKHGLESGTSKRSPAQVRADFRRAREAA